MLIRAAPSIITSSVEVGSSFTSNSGSYHFVRSSDLFTRRMFPFWLKDGGYCWFSCLKNSFDISPASQTGNIEPRKQRTPVFKDRNTGLFFWDNLCHRCTKQKYHDLLCRVKYFLSTLDKPFLDKLCINLSASFFFFSICRTAWATQGSGIVLVSSATKSLLESVNVFPTSPRVSTNDLTFWWSVLLYTSVLFMTQIYIMWVREIQYFKVSGQTDISGPATIQPRRVTGFSVKPAAPSHHHSPPPHTPLLPRSDFASAFFFFFFLLMGLV